MRHERQMSEDEVQEVRSQIKELQLHLKTHRKLVNDKLCWLTEIPKSDRQYLEDYFILKYQVLPSLKNILKNPVLYSYDSLDELLAEGDTDDKKRKQNNKSMGAATYAKRSKDGSKQSRKKTQNESK